MGSLVPRGDVRNAPFDRHLTKPVDPAIVDDLLRVEPERSARGRGA